MNASDIYLYRATTRRVVDGDTIDMDIDLGFGVMLCGDNGKGMRFRLFGIDTPESRTRDAREKRFGKLATARVQQLLPVGSKHTIRTTMDKRGKYGRAMADVLFEDGDTLCTLLVREFLAVQYHGQNKSEVQAAHEANYKILESQ